MASRTQTCAVDEIEFRNGSHAPPGSAEADGARRKAEIAEAIGTPLERFAGIDTQLSGASVDLKSVCEAIRCDAVFAARVVELSCLLAGEAGPAISCIEEAVVLQGPERFRMTLLSAALLDLRSGAALPVDDPALVRHGVLSALAAERLARRIRYPRSDLAYLMGLVHSLGNLHGRRMCALMGNGAAERRGKQTLSEDAALELAGGAGSQARARDENLGWEFEPKLASLLGQQLKMQEIRLDAALLQIVELSCAKARARSREVLGWACALAALGN